MRMELCKNSNNRISYSEFLNYLDSGGWSLSIGINDRMTIDEHLSYIGRITTYKDAIIEFVPDDSISELVERIDIYILPTIRESELSTNSIHIQFVKSKDKEISLWRKYY